MYRLSDRACEFAESRGRIPHERSRCCIVVEGNASLDREGSKTVTVVPTSSNLSIKNFHDVYIEAPPSPNNTPVYARIQHVMLVMRDELEDYIQQLKPDLVDEIMAALGLYLGLIDEPNAN
jgi:hypothetical protein